MPEVKFDPAGSELVSSGEVGKHYGRSRRWGWMLLRQWWEEQKRGGTPKVLKRGRVFYTTRAMLYADNPKGRDEKLWRKVTQLEKDLERAYTRLVELEKRQGMRR